MVVRIVQTLGLVAMLGMLAACAVTGPPAQTMDPGAAMPPPATPMSYGVVTRVDRLDGQPYSVGSGVLIGGAVGAIVGRELGEKALGRTAATVVGAAAGAMIGSEIERQHGSGGRERIRISVLFDSGGTRHFEQPASGELRVGDRVRVDNNRVHRF